MFALDIKTIAFANILVVLICALVVFLLWSEYRKRYSGIGFWALDFLLQTSALILIALRETIPDWISYVVANTLVILGTILLLIGLERFFEKKGNQIHNYILLVSFASIHIYFTFYNPNLTARNINVSAGIFLISIQIILFLTTRLQKANHKFTNALIIVFLLYSLISIGRILMLVIHPLDTNNYFESGNIEALILLLHFVLFVSLSYSLIMMVSRRLQYDILLQEEKFTKAFHLAPYAVIITRKKDGKILEINEGFTKISEYSYEEALGKTTLELKLWLSEDERLKMITQLLNKKSINSEEIRFRKKKGEILVGLFSAESLLINNEECILSCIEDITKRKQEEEELRKTKKELEETLEDFYTLRLSMEKNMKQDKVKTENNKIRNRIDYLKGKRNNSVMQNT